MRARVRVRHLRLRSVARRAHGRAGWRRDSSLVRRRRPAAPPPRACLDRRASRPRHHRSPAPHRREMRGSGGRWVGQGGTGGSEAGLGCRWGPLRKGAAARGGRRSRRHHAGRRAPAAQIESSRVESSRVEPSRVESSRVEPSRVESSRVPIMYVHECVHTRARMCASPLL